MFSFSLSFLLVYVWLDCDIVSNSVVCILLFYWNLLVVLLAYWVIWYCCMWVCLFAVWFLVCVVLELLIVFLCVGFSVWRFDFGFVVCYLCFYVMVVLLQLSVVLGLSWFDLVDLFCGFCWFVYGVDVLLWWLVLDCV